MLAGNNGKLESPAVNMHSGENTVFTVRNFSLCTAFLCSTMSLSLCGYQTSYRWFSASLITYIMRRSTACDKQTINFTFVSVPLWVDSL